MPTNPKYPPVYGKLRPSQIITTYGPGAVVDLEHASVLTAGIDTWYLKNEEAQVVDEPRLKSMLRVDKFYRPMIESDGGFGGIPAYLFPRYMSCTRCGRLAQYDQEGIFQLDGKRYRCLSSDHAKGTGKDNTTSASETSANNNKSSKKSVSFRKQPLVIPAPLVVACSNGHLDDFPWSYYVHRGKPCAASGRKALTLRHSGKIGGISDMSVTCSCGKRRTMGEAFDETKRENAIGTCRAAQPWLGAHQHEDSCDAELRTTQRGASNLYFSRTQSALSIPDWDDPIHAGLAIVENRLTNVVSVEKLKQYVEDDVFPELKPYDIDQVFRALQQRRAQADTPPTPLDIRREEFQALSHRHDRQTESAREFETEHIRVPEPFKNHIERVVVVRRLREVRVLTGFTRIDGGLDYLANDDEPQEQYKVQQLSKNDCPWLPAVELRGEGIFLQLSESALQEWETNQAVQSHTKTLAAAHQRWISDRNLPERPYPGPRFVLLHSLAHMLIREVALDCGYSATSIRERIYASSDDCDPPHRMAGMLLYTATPDSDGSLGGLADKGKPEQLAPLLESAFRRAERCSSDPLCGHSNPGELGHLNGAACHACLLESETSCERNNRYLDRAHVIETIAQLGTQFFDC
jgi:hypothetical protein